MGNTYGTVIFENYKVNHRRNIAEGGFGFVSLVEDDKGNKFAMKRVIVPFDDAERNALAQAEQNVLAIIPNHPNVVRFFGASTQEVVEKKQRHYCTLLEYCNGNVWDAMLEYKGRGEKFSERKVCAIFRDACLAIHHLHSQMPPIAHRDLKVENLLFGTDGNIKLTDFGSCSTNHGIWTSSREIKIHEEEISKNTTLAYRSPEQVDLYLQKKVCEKVDIWALGVLLYVLTTERTPFSDSLGNVEKLGILSGKYTFPGDWAYSQGLKDFIAFLLNPEPDERPSIHDVLSYGATQKASGVLVHWPGLPSNLAIWPSSDPPSPSPRSARQGFSLRSRPASRAGSGEVGSAAVTPRQGRSQSQLPGGVGRGSSGATPGSNGSASSLGESRTKGSSSEKYGPSGGAEPSRRTEGQVRGRQGASELDIKPTQGNVSKPVRKIPSTSANNGSRSGGGGGSASSGTAARSVSVPTSRFVSGGAAGDDDQDAVRGYWAGDDAYEGLQSVSHSQPLQSTGGGGGVPAGGIRGAISEHAKQIGGSLVTMMQQANLSLADREAEMTSWVKKATNSSPGFPKAKHLRHMVIALWESEMGVDWLLSKFRQRPWAESALVSCKILVTIMKVMQQGPPKLLAGYIGYVDLIDQIDSHWKNMSLVRVNEARLAVAAASSSDPPISIIRSSKANSASMLAFITRFAELVRQKLHFHSFHPEFGAHFTTMASLLSRDTLPADMSPPSIPGVLTKLFKLMISLQATVQGVFKVSESGTEDRPESLDIWNPTPDEISTAQGALLPIIEESYVLFVATIHLVDILCGSQDRIGVTGGVVKSLRDQFDQHYEGLKVMYRDCYRIPFVRNMDCIPKFPDENPLTRRRSVPRPEAQTPPQPGTAPPAADDADVRAQVRGSGSGVDGSEWDPFAIDSEKATQAAANSSTGGHGEENPSHFSWRNQSSSGTLTVDDAHSHFSWLESRLAGEGRGRGALGARDGSERGLGARNGIIRPAEPDDEGQEDGFDPFCLYGTLPDPESDPEQEEKPVAYDRLPEAFATSPKPAQKSSEIPLSTPRTQEAEGQWLPFATSGAESVRAARGSGAVQPQPPVNISNFAEFPAISTSTRKPMEAEASTWATASTSFPAFDQPPEQVFSFPKSHASDLSSAAQASKYFDSPVTTTAFNHISDAFQVASQPQTKPNSIASEQQSVDYFAFPSSFSNPPQESPTIQSRGPTSTTSNNNASRTPALNITTNINNYFQSESNKAGTPVAQTPSLNITTNINNYFQAEHNIVDGASSGFPKRQEQKSEIVSAVPLIDFEEFETTPFGQFAAAPASTPSSRGQPFQEASRARPGAPSINSQLPVAQLITNTASSAVVRAPALQSTAVVSSRMPHQPHLPSRNERNPFSDSVAPASRDPRMTAPSSVAASEASVSHSTSAQSLTAQVDAVYCPPLQPWRDELLSSPHADVQLRQALELGLNSFSQWGKDIRFDALEVECVIGTGAFAVVYKAKIRTNGVRVAVKKLLSTAGQSLTAKTLRDFVTEVDFMRTLRHPNIVDLMATCSNPLCVLMEFCDRGNLMSVLQDNTIELSMQRRLGMMTDIASGMSYLHSRNPIVIHRDLKSLNVLITYDWVAKITDFGLSRISAEAEHGMMTGQIGTYHWMAPEVMSGTDYTAKADVYSFAIIAWEILTRQTPFPGMNPAQIIMAVVNSNLRPTIPKDCPRQLSELVVRSWHPNPKERPPFLEVYASLKMVQSLV